MYGRFPTYVSLSFCAVLLVTAACNRGGATPTSPSAAGAKATLTAEPSIVSPEFIGGEVCPTHPRFGVRVTVFVGGPDLIVRGIRFGFADRFGRSALPEVIFLPAGSSPLLPNGPVPFGRPGFSTLPNSSPIPIPGAPPINGVLVPERAALSLPFFLRFPCDLFPEGTLTVTGELSDRSGRPELPKMELRVRRS